MTAVPRTRTRHLVLAVAATLAATVWAAVQDDDDAAAAPAPARPAQRVVAARSEPGLVSPAPSTWPELRGVEARPAWRQAEPQGIAGWGPPAPPPPAAAPLPSPVASAPAQAPEFPYTLIGRLDDGRPRALLTNRTRSFGAISSDVIDGVWRVDAVEPEGVTLTWLPGGVSRTLAFPSS